MITAACTTQIEMPSVWSNATALFRQNKRSLPGPYRDDVAPVIIIHTVKNALKQMNQKIKYCCDIRSLDESHVIMTIIINGSPTDATTITSEFNDSRSSSVKYPGRVHANAHDEVGDDDDIVADEVGGPTHVIRESDGVSGTTKPSGHVMVACCGRDVAIRRRSSYGIGVRLFFPRFPLSAAGPTRAFFFRVSE